MSIFPLAIAGAIIGGGLGFGQARARNKAIERAALISQRRINKLMVQVRMDSAISTEQLSRAAQRALGGALNMSPERQGALDAIGFEIDGIFSDQIQIELERDRRLEALGADKINIATEATNSSQNLLLAGLGGAFEGAQAGLSLGSAISEAQTQARTADLARQEGEIGLQRSQIGLQTDRLNFDAAFNRLGTTRRLVGGARRALGSFGRTSGTVVQFN